MDRKAPAISIVIPLFNKGSEVRRAVVSVLAQTVQDFEVIVIDDGSSDDGPDIVRAVDDPRVMVVTQENEGVSSARNRGIAEAKASLIAFLDADDEWMPDFLETILCLRRQFPVCEVFATSYFFATPDGGQRKLVIKGLPHDFEAGVLHDYFLIASESDPPVWSSAVAITRKAIVAVGGFPVGVTSGEDLLTWARLAARYDIAYSIKPKAIFWTPTDLVRHIPRTPQKPDIVGQELSELLAGVALQKRRGLNRYIGLWHRMRANIFLRLGRRREVLREVARSMRHAPLDIRLLLYAVLAVLPLSPSIMMALRELVRKRNEMV
jgi:glycosyltransferase involved in cell wall biosynthesis